MKTDDLLDKVKQGLTEAGLSIDDKPRLLVAVSGGADSVCLLRALLMLGCDCTVAHCNFHLRGEESNRDERFVRGLCGKLGVNIHVEHFDARAEAQAVGISIEMACRQLRYRWFRQLSDELVCSRVAVAHHADDDVETFFLNLMRGTGIHGLKGMRRSTSFVVRPMLDVTRQQVMKFLQEVGQDYVTDSTNLENDYKRNRVRNIVLPEIDKQFLGARERVRDTMQHLADECELLDGLLESFWEKHCRNGMCGDFSSYFVPRTVFGVTFCPQGLLLYALLKSRGDLSFTRSQCEQAVKASVGARFCDGSYTLTICREGFEIQKNAQGCDEEINLNLRDACCSSPLGVMPADKPFSKDMVDGRSVVAFSNAVMACKRVVLRRWRKGDRMRPFGMRGTKLLSDLFVDLKLTPAQKSAVWLLEADGKILWVVGHRAAHEFVVTHGATDYVILKMVGQRLNNKVTSD